MDVPVFVPGNGLRAPHPYNRSELQEDDSLLDVLRDIFFCDDKHEFINLITHLPSEEKVPEAAWMYMFAYDSLNCGAAALAGEANGRLNLKAALADKGLTPLHEAARHASSKLTALFLEHGETANARIDFGAFNMKEALPLNVALQRISSHCFLEEWACHKSAFSLVAKLCGIALSKYLETVRLLARNTEELDQEFCNYVKEGKMAEVGTLLMVGFRPSSMTMQLLQCEDKIPEKEGIEQLFDIFQRVGDKLDAYIRIKRKPKMPNQVVAEIASILRDTGLPVKYKDLPIDNDVYRLLILQANGTGQQETNRSLGLNREPGLGGSVQKFGGSSFRGFRPYHTSSIMKEGSSMAAPVMRQRALFATALRWAKKYA